MLLDMSLIVKLERVLITKQPSPFIFLKETRLGDNETRKISVVVPFENSRIRINFVEEIAVKIPLRWP